MARKVNPEEYAARRKDILDSAARFIYSKGFEQMTIQDILEDLQISKGGFYHYFDSKADVQKALVERVVLEEVMPMLEAIVHDPNLSALEKLHAYFNTSARWKSAQKEWIISLMRAYYSDENILFRQKLYELSLKMVTPFLGEIIEQGVQEGVFTVSYPQRIGEAILYVMQGLSDKIVSLLLLSDQMKQDDPQVIEGILEYSDVLSSAIERILGAPPDSIHPFDPEMLRQWFVPAKETVVSSQK